MKWLIQHQWLSTALAMGLLAAAAGKVVGQTLVVSSNSNEPLSVQVRSGGSVDSKDCGFINTAPNQVINVTNRLNYMRLSVQGAGGEPTLLVDGPGGRFCVLADAVSGEAPEISGVWLPGNYSVYVGDRTGSQHQYTLQISPQK